MRGRDNILQLVTKRESGRVGWKTQPRGASLLDPRKDHGCPGPKLVAQPQRIRQRPRGVGYDDADSLIAILFTEVRTQDIEIVCRSIRINSQILDKDKWRVRGFRWWRKRLRSFGETTDISEYPHRGIEWCAATAPLV